MTGHEGHVYHIEPWQITPMFTGGTRPFKRYIVRPHIDEPNHYLRYRERHDGKIKFGPKLMSAKRTWAITSWQNVNKIGQRSPKL